MSTVGQRIKKRRLHLGMSQERLATLAEVSQKQISRYESGSSDPTGDVIVALSHALETSTDYLLGETDDPSPLHTRDDLAPLERSVIAAMRRGDRAAAAKLVLTDE